jgi:hypothetical protein
MKMRALNVLVIPSVATEGPDPVGRNLLFSLS